MEGANTTRKKGRKDTARKGLKNKSEQMIMNNYITMKYIVQHKNEAISAEKYYTYINQYHQ
jgi:hypothetical protein